MRILRRFWVNESGQALPLMLLFLLLIVGLASVVVDGGRIHALRAQASAATTAAALATANTINNSLTTAAQTYGPNLTGPELCSAVSGAEVSAVANGTTVYQTNIKGALPSQGLADAPDIAVNTANCANGEVSIQATASGTAPLYLGRAVGVSTAAVNTTASTYIGAENGVPASALLPLALPANGGVPGVSMGPSLDGTWENYFHKNETFFAFRGSNGGNTPSLPPGTPAIPPTVPLNFLTLFGPGNDGILNLNGSYVDIGNTVYVGSHTGSAEWNSLSSITPGETVYILVGDSTQNGNSGAGISVVGYVTARVIAGNGGKGTNAGFSFTIEHLSATLPTAQLGGTQPGVTPTFSYQLVPN